MVELPWRALIPLLTPSLGVRTVHSISRNVTSDRTRSATTYVGTSQINSIDISQRPLTGIALFFVLFTFMLSEDIGQELI
jgi:hypothetical protein